MYNEVSSGDKATFQDLHLRRCVKILGIRHGKSSVVKTMFHIPSSSVPANDGCHTAEIESANDYASDPMSEIFSRIENEVIARQRQTKNAFAARQFEFRQGANVVVRCCSTSSGGITGQGRDGSR